MHKTNPGYFEDKYRAKDLYKTTNANSVYTKTRKQYLANKGKIRCTYCKYHKNENKTSKIYGVYFFNNKPFDIENDVVFPNWKLASKNKKQWQIKNNVISKTKKTKYGYWLKFEIVPSKNMNKKAYDMTNIKNELQF